MFTDFFFLLRALDLDVSLNEWLSLMEALERGLCRNSLLEFYINETKETITAKHRPIVIITSNAEKELPDAFLRRCIFHYISFPDAAMMTDIVHAHYDNIEDHLLEMAMRAFYQVRDLPTVAKKPSTSELLDWLQALRIGGVDPDKIEKELPYAGILLKKTEDLTAVKNAKNRVKNGYRW